MKTPEKILVALFGNEVSPRFDLATEVMIARVDSDARVSEEKTLVLPHASAEKLLHMIVREEVQVVICGGIEEEHYQYLTWKRVNVIDSVVGDVECVLDRYARDGLRSGDLLLEDGRRSGTPADDVA